MAFDDHFHEECGVFGIFNIEDAAAHVALGLHALQHRGQEATGIVSYDGTQFYAHRAIGMVDQAFGKGSNATNELKGRSAIGHNRYSTTGESMLRNVQPLFADLDDGGIAVAHNGNLTNAVGLRRKLVSHGSLFQSTSDTEVILHLLAEASGILVNRLITALKSVEGAYSLIALTRRKMIGVRDPMGVRPLVLGRLQDTYILASESCALDILGATLVREIEAGEMVVIDADGLTSLKPFQNRLKSDGSDSSKQTHQGHFCIFEYVYFSRPDSIFHGQSVYETRINIGHELAKEHLLKADVIVPVPDSGVPSAIGYAEATGIPFQFGIIRNHYVGRTFIEPTNAIRNLGVKLKHNANRHVVRNKHVVLVDDSLVRGTTSKKIVEMIRQAGAKSVALLIASPPTKHSCFYGVDTPSSEELLANQYNIAEMQALIGVDYLGFISLDGLYRAVGMKDRPEAPHKRRFCDACFSGDYPINLKDHHDLALTQKPPKQLSLLKDKNN